MLFNVENVFTQTWFGGRTQITLLEHIFDFMENAVATSNCDRCAHSIKSQAFRNKLAANSRYGRNKSVSIPIHYKIIGVPQLFVGFDGAKRYNTNLQVFMTRAPFGLPN